MVEAHKFKWYDVEFVPRIRFSENFLKSYEVGYPDSHARRVSGRIECLGGWEPDILKWIRVDAGIEVDYDYLKSVAMDAMGMGFEFAENPHIVEMATRGWIFTERLRKDGPLPETGDVLVCGTKENPIWWEKIVLVLPEDVCDAELAKMSAEDRASAKEQAKAWWNTDRRNWVEKGYDAIVSALRAQHAMSR